MNTDAGKVGSLFFLLHPGTVQFSGYGLTVEAGSKERLVGLLMIDRPQRASRTWLAKVERTFGGYTLHRMTLTGERGILCQMWIAKENLSYVCPVTGTFTQTLQEALFPLLLVRPKPQFRVSWDGQSRVWRSEFYQPTTETHITTLPSAGTAPRFEMGHLVATPGALSALEDAGQLPQEFLYRHMAGDWGNLDPHDRQMNEDALSHGGRLFSAYLTKKGAKIWIITESDHSATTILLPAEY